MSTTFGTGSTRQIQPGDTPDLNDGLLSRLIVNTLSLIRGNACYLVGGEINLATLTLSAAGHPAFVPIESVDNANDGESASGVESPQRVALQVEASTTAIAPGDYVKPSSGSNLNGTVEKWIPTTDAHFEKYAKYLGKEAALLDVEIGTPFEETLTPGVVPDQTLAPTAEVGDEANVGWFQLVPNSGGAAT